MKLALPRIIAACLALGAAACDSLATGSYRPSYFTIDARISSSLPPSDVQVAVLWLDQSSTHQSFTEQLLQVKPGVADVKIGFTDLPPPEVLHTVRADLAQMYGLDPTLQWAFGTLVAYLDNDHDGKLGLVAMADQTSPDTIIGAATDVDIFYLATGTPAPDGFIGIFPTRPGFSLVREPAPDDLPQPGQCGHFDGNGHYSSLCEPAASSLPTLMATTDVVSLTLMDGFDQRWSCSTFLGPIKYPDWEFATPDQVCDGGPDVCPFCRGYQCPLDLPPASDPDPLHRFEKACSLDGLAYTYRTCHDDPSLCGTTFCHYGHGERLAGDPAPAGWPCP
jgi:hypothetical protein